MSLHRRHAAASFGAILSSVLQLLPVLGLIFACVQEEPSLLAMRIAQINAATSDQTNDGWPPRCKISDPRPFQFEYLAGNAVTGDVSSEPNLILLGSHIERIRVVEMKSFSTPDVSVFEVRITPRKEKLEEAKQLRSDCPAQHVLVSVAGDAVWLEPPWSTWGGEIPGGIFATRDEALSNYAEFEATAEYSPADDDAHAALVEQIDAQRELALWKFACDVQHRERVRSLAPDIYESLIQDMRELKAIDCDTKPMNAASPGT